MEIAKLFLDYLKTLMWPLILIIAFLKYDEQIFYILKNRDVEAFGLKIGNQISSISDSYTDEIGALKEQIAQLESEDNRKVLIERVNNIEKSVQRNLELVTNKNTPEQSKVEKAKSAEREGFEAIINRDAEAALAAFEKAERIWPEYHNVSEIKSLLATEKKHLKGDDDWQKIYDVILTKHTWGMPRDLRSRLKQRN